MSSGKSKLKTDVFRYEPFSAALHVTEAGALVPSEAVLTVRTICEDASVRLAAGPPVRQQLNGADLLAMFWRPVQAAFAALPNAHTYVLMFDKKQFVPRQKG